MKHFMQTVRVPFIDAAQVLVRQIENGLVIAHLF
jgi:hypothetical protein